MNIEKHNNTPTRNLFANCDLAQLEEISILIHAGRSFQLSYMEIAEQIYNADYRKQEWISVDERLPEKEEIVLCCLGLVMNVYTYRGDNIWEDSYGYYQKDEPTTHWMPLPEFPKMKGGERK